MKVSIIVPIYNADKKIGRTIKSIQNQTLSDIEIILVNDGSTDNSLSICRSFGEKDDRIRIIDKQNGGVSSARNAGLKVANGLYVGFVDAGDMITPMMYEKMYNNANMLNAEIVFCNYKVIRNRRQKLVELNIASPLTTRESIIDLIGNMISRYNSKDKRFIMGSICRVMFKKGLIYQHGIKFREDIELMEDLIFCIETLLRASVVTIDTGFYYHYILERHSASTRYRADMLKIRKKVYNHLKKIVLSNSLYEELKDCLTDRYIDIYTGSISNEFRAESEKGLIDKIKTIKRICVDERLIEVVNVADVGRYDKRKRFIIMSIKYKQWFCIYLYYYLISIKSKIPSYTSHIYSMAKPISRFYRGNCFANTQVGINSPFSDIIR